MVAAPVRDLLALATIGAHAVVWVVYMVALIVRDLPVPEPAWAILPTGVAAALMAVYGPDYAYRGRHHE